MITLNMKENHYSIKDLENLTHIKVHTIRIWEQRYNLLSPQRTNTNIRFYNDNDLKKILNVNTLYKNGLKISRIAALSEEEIISKVNELIGEKGTVPDSIQELINLTMQLDEEGISELLYELFNTYGMSKLYAEVLIPTFIRIGELWQLNSLSVGHEHFFTNIVRNFIITQTTEVKVKQKNGKSVILFLHAAEEHEISLLVYHFLLKKEGYNCFYLGQNTPISDLETIYKQVLPDFIIANFVKILSEEVFIEIIDSLSKMANSDKLVLGGAQAIKFREFIHQESTLIESEKDLDIFLPS